MPTYDYRCKACGHAIEIFHSMSEAPKRKCPECGALKLERQIGTGGGILFKGGGFYETDYRSHSYKKAAEAEKKSTEPAKAEGKVDSGATKKPEAAAKKAEGKKKPSE